MQKSDCCREAAAVNVLSLHHLHADVLRLVFDQLLEESPSTLPAVSRVCRLFYELVNPFIYRNFMLGISWQRDCAAKEIVSRILDDRSRVRNYVRHIKVGDFANVELLKPVLSRLTRLESIVFQDFSWEALHDVQLVGLLEDIVGQNPRTKIHFETQDDVGSLTENSNMPFLNSANLYSLTTCVGPDFNRRDPFSVTLSHLKRLIISYKNLRALELDIAELPGEEPPCFGFDDGDKFPSLKELVLRGYSFTQANCVAWRHCMDWSQLRRLSFGTDYQPHFMQNFQDRLPNLRGFTTGIRANDSSNELDRFISSIKSLEELKISNFTEENLSISLLTRPGRSLLTLKYRSQFIREGKYPPVLSIDEIEALVNRCPRLVNLVLGVELRTEKLHDILAILARLPLLRHLVIHVEIDEDNVTVLDPEIGKPTAKAIFEIMRAKNPASKNFKLDIVFEIHSFLWDHFMYREMGMPTLREATIRCSSSERDDRPDSITIESDEDVFMKLLGKKFKPGSTDWMRQVKRYESANQWRK